MNALTREFQSIIDDAKAMDNSCGQGLDPNGGPEEKGYESQYGIVEMLKTVQSLGSAKEEVKSAHAVNMVQQDLTDSIDNANKDTKPSRT